MTIRINEDIDTYLDATAGLHGGIDSKKFGELISRIGQKEGLGRVTKKGIAEAMGNISRTTFRSYYVRYNEKHAKDHDRSPVQ